MIELNLLPKQNVLFQKDAALRKRFVIVVIFTSILLVFDTVLYSLINNVLESRVSLITQKKNSLQVSLEGYSSVYLDLQTVEQKAGSIDKIRNIRKNFPQIISKIRSILGGGVDFNILDVDSTGLISVSAKASDPDSLSRFISRIAASDLKNVVLSNLRQEGEKSFTFQIKGS